MYVTHCQVGWAWVGSVSTGDPCRPQNLVRWCDSSPCKNGGKCWQTNTLYRCECHSGWTGLYCDVPNVSCEVAAQRQGNRPRPTRHPLGPPDLQPEASRPRPLPPPQTSTSPTCAGTGGSAWTQATPTIAAARRVTQAATARTRWMSARPAPARTGPPAPTTRAATPVRWAPVLGGGGVCWEGHRMPHPRL